jgi:phospholipid/cholesterol/gamma-HCH transport system substrate-binding protein
MERLGDILRSKLLRLGLVLVVLAAGVAVAIDLTKAASTYPLNAVYASAPGLFPGAAVDVLGVPVGTVVSVKTVEDRVEVGMRVRSTTRIPSAAIASLVAPEVLGQPDVDLNPGYTGGPRLAPGAIIPESRTSVPVSTDVFLKELQRTLKTLNPHAVGDLITNLAQDLDGQGAGLNQLIASAAGTIQLLADKGNDLGQLNGTLAQLTGTLDSDTSQIEQLVQQYDTVSTVIAQHSGQLNDALTQLTGATTSLVTLLTPNLLPLESDVGTVTTVGRTLDRNIGNLDELLAQSSSLFQDAQRAFDPNYNWLNLNAALSPGVTGEVEVGYVVDALAGVCRRLTANDASLVAALAKTDPTVVAELTACGNPSSSFFASIVSEIPTLLDTLSGSHTSDTPASPSSLMQQGLDKIGSIGASSTPQSTTSSSSSGTTTTTPAPTPTPTTTTTTTTPPSCGLLGVLIGCPGGSTSKTTSHSTTTSGGLGGLLSDDISPHQAQQATVQLASSAPSGTTLTAPSARYLPPMPSHRHHHRGAHRGLLAQWAHDVRSWL